LNKNNSNKLTECEGGFGIRLYDLRTRKVEQKWETPSPLNSSLWYLENLVAVTSHGKIFVYDFRKSQMLAEMSVGKRKVNSKERFSFHNEFKFFVLLD
jgi:hypothetical protein